MPTLNVSVANKIASADVQYVVCDNSDYVVKFTFDSDWDEYTTKIMRIVFPTGEYTEVTFDGDECALPVVSNQSSLDVGVYAGEIQTTTPARIYCKKSILSSGSSAAKPYELCKHYMHICYITYSSTVKVYANLFNKDETPFTAESLCDWLTDNEFAPSGSKYPIVGKVSGAGAVTMVGTTVGENKAINFSSESGGFVAMVSDLLVADKVVEI